MFASSIENIQTIIPKNNYYDIIWAVHSLYTLDINKIKDVLQHIGTLLKPGGILLMYQASSDSCYSQLHDFYLKNYDQVDNSVKYITAEDIEQRLDLLGLQYDAIDFNYNHEIDYKEQNLLEVYLKKCILNNSVDVLELFKEKILQSFSPQKKKFIFKQKTNLIVITKPVF